MKYIITYFPEFKKLALKEVAQASGAFARDIDKGMCVIDGAESLAVELTAADPVFVRHIMPVHFEDELCGEKEADCATILAAAKQYFILQKGERFSVQCRILNTQRHMYGNVEKAYSTRDIEIFIGSYFDSTGAVSVFSTSELVSEQEFKVISIFVHNQKFYLGFSNVKDNLNAHCDEHRILSRIGREISRAENKLKEAVVKFELKLNGEGRALDIGAAPGGWTKVLADFGYKVTAVDPGMLNDSLYEHPHITHIKDKVENVVFNEGFDVTVNDMNCDPQDAAQIMVDIAKLLKSSGVAVLTLKLPFSDVERSIRESVEILEQAYIIKSIKSLSHNRREVTVLLGVK